MQTVPDLRAQDAAAVRASTALVAHVRRADLQRPTPCAGWDLAALLAHMTAQHRGFAASAGGRGATMDAWRVRPLGDDPAAEYAEAGEQVVAAFAADDVPDRMFALPEFGDGVRVPGRQAVSFHFIDYVIHCWDVARSLELPFPLPTDLVRTALPVAEAIPDDPGRRAPGAAFAPRLPVPDGADPLDRVLALVGRSPSWPDH